MEALDDEVLEILSSLIAFKNRADAKGWRDAFENMPIYLEVTQSIDVYERVDYMLLGVQLPYHGCLHLQCSA
jgi:hypothetical protein